MWFPTVDDVIEMHARIIDAAPPDVPRIHGVLYAGAIDAAIERARWGPFSSGGGLAERAALIIRGIAQDHPFADGNKRTAFELADIFLRRNGLALVGEPEDIVNFMLTVAKGEMELDAISTWITAHARNN